MDTPTTLVSSLSGTRYDPLKFWITRIGTFLLIAAALYAAQMFLTPKLGIYDLRILVNSLLFATLAVSLNLINGITGQFSMGHAAFYLSGAIVSGKLSTVLYKGSGIPDWAWLPLMVLAGGLAAGLIGLMVGIPSLRLRGDYLAVMTMGFGEIARVIVINQDGGSQAFSLVTLLFAFVWAVVFAVLAILWWMLSPKLKGMSIYLRAPIGMGAIALAIAAGAGLIMLLKLTGLVGAISGVAPLNLGGAYGLQGVPKLTEFYHLVLLLILAIALSRNLLKTAHGLSFLAVREDELAADATGVHSTRIKVLAFALGAALAGMAGALFAHYNRSVSPDDFKMDVSFMLVAMVVMGGTGSITGAALAGLGLKMLEEGLRALPGIPALTLYSLVVALVLAVTLTSLLKKLITERAKRIVDLLLILPGLAGLVFAGIGAYRVWGADVSVVIKVAITTIAVGLIVACLIPRNARTALPKIGMIVMTLAIAYGLSFAAARGLTQWEAARQLLDPIKYQAADLRWALFSISLVIVMITRPQGLLSHHEFSWDFVRNLFSRKRPAEVPA